jgi:hypothetical protein
MELVIKDWQKVKDVGMPKDGDFCFVIFGSEKDGYAWNVGGYHEEKELFYVNLGLGGMVIQKEKVIAWKLWDEVKLL